MKRNADRTESTQDAKQATSSSCGSDHDGSEIIQPVVGGGVAEPFDEELELSQEDLAELEDLDDLSEPKLSIFSPERLAILKEAEESARRGAANNRSIDRAQARLKARAEYRRERELEGKTVRSYQSQTYPDAPKFEPSDERVKRQKREYARRRRGKTGETVRAYNDLSDMTKGEKADYQREQARLRQQARRIAKGADKPS